MVKRKQTTQWSKENRQHNGQKKTDKQRLTKHYTENINIEEHESH
jgi:hypothetical protein